MGSEKNFETRVKTYLRSVGVYPLGTAGDKMTIPPIGYYEKRWGGGYSKSGLPDMHIVVNGINIDVELKASSGKPSELQKHNIRQINESGSIGLLLYPEGFDYFKEIIQGVIECSIHIPGWNALNLVTANTKCDTLTDSKPSHPMEPTMR